MSKITGSIIDVLHQLVSDSIRQLSRTGVVTVNPNLPSDDFRNAVERTILRFTYRYLDNEGNWNVAELLKLGNHTPVAEVSTPVELKETVADLVARVERLERERKLGKPGSARHYCIPGDMEFSQKHEFPVVGEETTLGAVLNELIESPPISENPIVGNFTVKDFIRAGHVDVMRKVETTQELDTPITIRALNLQFPNKYCATGYNYDLKHIVHWIVAPDHIEFWIYSLEGEFEKVVSPNMDKLNSYPVAWIDLRETCLKGEPKSLGGLPVVFTSDKYEGALINENNEGQAAYLAIERMTGEKVVYLFDENGESKRVLLSECPPGIQAALYSAYKTNF